MYVYIRTPFNSNDGMKKLKAKTLEPVNNIAATQKDACTANTAGLADALCMYAIYVIVTTSLNAQYFTLNQVKNGVKVARINANASSIPPILIRNAISGKSAAAITNAIPTKAL
jgi:hypothetical protein